MMTAKIGLGYLVAIVAASSIQVAISTPAAISQSIDTQPNLVTTSELTNFRSNPTLAKKPSPKAIAADPTVQLLNGTWEGSYTCQQGLTKLKLIVKAKSLDNIRAFFVFSADESNPTVPVGSFKMQGSATSTGAIKLKATDWLKKPDGYLTVDLEGNISASDRRISGNIVSTTPCTTFNVVKVKS
jgi:uncharacterized protein with FMN-binding domain